MYKTRHCTAENVTNVNTFENESKQKYWGSFLENSNPTSCVFAKPITNLEHRYPLHSYAFLLFHSWSYNIIINKILFENN